MNRIETFYLICNCLAPSSSSSTSLRGTLSPQTVVWEEVIRMAGHHLVTPALFWSLQEKELLDELPVDVREYLEAAWLLNHQRNQRLLAQLVEVCGRLNQHAIQPVLLKGAAALAMGLYPHPAIRMMADLDLLIPRQQLSRARKILHDAGYTDFGPFEIPAHHHLAPLVRSDRVAAVELHRAVTDRRYGRLLPTERVVEESRLLRFHGISARLPSPQWQIRHNLVHSQLQDGNHAQCRVDLRQLMEFVILQRRFHSEIDRELIQQDFYREGRRNVLASYQFLAEYLLGGGNNRAEARYGYRRSRQRCLERGIESRSVMLLRMSRYRLGNMVRTALTRPRAMAKLVHTEWYARKCKNIRKMVTGKSG